MKQNKKQLPYKNLPSRNPEFSSTLKSGINGWMEFLLKKNKINKIGGMFFVKIFKTSGAPSNSSFYEVLKRVEV